MTTIEFLTDLEKAGANVTVRDGKLRCEAPKGVITEDLKQLLATHKAEIISLLQAEAATNGHGRPCCCHCSKFGPIGAEAGCSKPSDPSYAMGELIECRDFVMKTVH
jgi:hypothetical protein